MTIETQTWHGEPALRLASSELEVIVLPHRGAKIASLIDSAGRQWLAQPEAGALPQVGYGTSFTDAEMCGWDEMAPTIVSAALPDHGEIWAVPWHPLEVTDLAVELSVSGRALPYILRRRID